VSEEIIIRGPSGPPLCGRVRLDDFDAIPGLSPVWDERYRQIGRGRPAIQIALASTTRLQLVYMSRNPGVLVQGAAVGGAALLGIPLSGSHLFLRRKPWERDAVGYAPPGGEYEILSTSPHRMLALAVAPGLLDTVAMETLGTTMASFAGASQLRLRDPAASEALRRCWLRWLSAVAASPTLLADPAMARRMEAEILTAFFGALAPREPEWTASSRRQLALRAEAYIRDTLGDPIPLPAICDAVGTSTRTLHASFQQVFGLPPKAYQKALRLDAVRRELLQAREGDTVSAVAGRWGFFQFGYFAMDYRRMFGESPRETLRRGRAGRGRPFHAPPAAERFRA
jgi:AraC family ethanolamine operon transcriptional activator